MVSLVRFPSAVSRTGTRLLLLTFSRNHGVRVWPSPMSHSTRSNGMPSCVKSQVVQDHVLSRRGQREKPLDTVQEDDFSSAITSRKQDK
jgi:hypothetical protein